MPKVYRTVHTWLDSLSVAPLGGKITFQNQCMVDHLWTTRNGVPPGISFSSLLRFEVASRLDNLWRAGSFPNAHQDVTFRRMKMICHRKLYGDEFYHRSYMMMSYVIEVIWWEYSIEFIWRVIRCRCVCGYNMFWTRSGCVDFLVCIKSSSRSLQWRQELWKLNSVHTWNWPF